MCNMNKQLLYSYADDSIEPLEKIILEEHLKYCEECTDELIKIRNMEYELTTFDFEDKKIPLNLYASISKYDEKTFNYKTLFTNLVNSIRKFW